jgi:hypothetical protein
MGVCGKPLQISSCGRIQNRHGIRYFPKIGRNNRRTVCIKGVGHLQVHTIVNVTFNDPDLKAWVDGDTVDHILSHEPWNNHRRNLRWANRPLQRKNQGRFHSNNDPLQRPVEIRMRGHNSWTEYPSLRAAADKMGVNNGTLSKVVNGVESRKAYDARFKEEPNLAGEEWMSVAKTDCHVSNMGRCSTVSSGKHFPTTKDDGYCQPVKFDGSIKPIGYHILKAFGVPQPPGKTTVEHKNGIRNDNRLNNLEWADAKDQCKTRQSVSLGDMDHVHALYEVLPVGGSTWLRCTSIEAVHVFGIERTAVAKGADPKSRNKTVAGTFEGVPTRFSVRRLETNEDIPGEEWRIVDVDEWKPGGKYYCVRHLR